MSVGDGRPSPVGLGRGSDLSLPISSRISVALCTFEGERYLPELLESIDCQLRAPDEVVVCDDGSTDRTVEILRAFQRRASFPVRIHLNDARLGSTKNYEKAISLCRHPVIVLSDQDDVWHAEKLAKVGAVLESRPEVGAVFHDAELIDERSRRTGRSLWEMFGFDESRLRRLQRGEGWDVLLEGNAVSGATLAFRSSWRGLIVPIPEGWIQDYWIALLIAAVSEVRALPEPLTRYRLHAGQQIGVGRITASGRRGVLLRRMRSNQRALLLEESRQLRLLLDRLEERSDAAPPHEGVLRDLDDKSRHLERRGTMPRLRHRWPVVLEEIHSGRYRRYSSGISAAVKDLLLLDRGSPPVEPPAWRQKIGRASPGHWRSDPEFRTNDRR